MARKAKLEGVELDQFMQERYSGMKLKDLAVKYGLTPSRLCQIYMANSKEDDSETAHQMELPLVHDTGWMSKEEAEAIREKENVD